MDYTEAALTEAKRQIDSLTHKLRETVKTLEGKPNASSLKSQITLAKRRVDALEIASALMERELNTKPRVPKK